MTSSTSASTTGSAELRARMALNVDVLAGLRCWTITTEAGKSFGSADNSVGSAWMPPADAPIKTTGNDGRTSEPIMMFHPVKFALAIARLKKTHSSEKFHTDGRRRRCRRFV